MAKKFPGWKVVIPSDGHYAAYYSQAISATAPDPAAARLWEEYLYSTTGQNLWLQGSARPIELASLVKNGTANKAALAALPAAPKGAITFPTRGADHGGRERRVAELGLVGQRVTLGSAPGVSRRIGHAPSPRRRARNALVAAAGIVPFGIYVTIFLVVPAVAVVIGAFRSPRGSGRGATSRSPRTGSTPTAS